MPDRRATMQDSRSWLSKLIVTGGVPSGGDKYSLRKQWDPGCGQMTQSGSLGDPGLALGSVESPQCALALSSMASIGTSYFLLSTGTGQATCLFLPRGYSSEHSQALCLRAESSVTRSSRCGGFQKGRHGTPEPNVPMQLRQGTAASLPPVEYCLFTTTDVNTDSSLVGSHRVNGQVPIQGRCCVTAQRNNASLPRGDLGEAGAHGLP